MIRSSGRGRWSGLARVVLAVAIVAAMVLVLSAARADGQSGCVLVEPVEGLPELPVEVDDECPDPDPVPALVCRQGFAWGGECWRRGEGQAFAGWLRDHGASPAAFKRRHPELAATFGAGWPGPNWQAMDRSFPRALRYAAGRWGVSYQWLHACASSEGGTDPGYFAIGTHGDSGWFQFLPGTWAWMSNSAFQSRGAPPAAYRHIRSVVGQTYTAAWAFSRGLSYHWYGRGC